MFLEQIIELEDAKAERDFLESIGPIGRIFDDHNSYILFMIIGGATVTSVGFLIGLKMFL